MDKQPTLGLAFPPDLSDEAAYEISEFLQALSLAFEQRYFSQIRRHLQAIRPQRNDFIDPPWSDDDDERSF
jgi:hypothetical protein